MPMLVIGVGGKPKAGTPPGFLGEERREGERGFAPKTAPSSSEYRPRAETPSPGGKVSSDRAIFHDQNENCSGCKNFDAGSNDCSRVEVDFASSDPSVSWCHFFEGGNHEAGESPATEKGEDVAGGRAA